MQEAADWAIDPNAQNWRVGPNAITADHLYIVGLIHVSAGTWQPSTFSPQSTLISDN